MFWRQLKSIRELVGLGGLIFGFADDFELPETTMVLYTEVLMRFQLVLISDGGS